LSDIAIKVEGLSKLYQLGAIGTGNLGTDITRWWASVRGKEDPFAKLAVSNDRSQKATTDFVWSLRDLNFEIKKGDAVGIIGKNGAGKSTLLKILSRTTNPTTGKVKINGRVASLLEVGTGFHGDLTGRENIFMNGAILGMSRSEITSKLEEIIEFSGVAGYIDTPVKRYSSGMYVRLAFAVAAHLEPDILIVDEVLAVGDAEFQKKCIGKMQDVNSKEGRTLLFVSHNMAAVERLCNMAIVLKDGSIFSQGPTKESLRHYFSFTMDNIVKDITQRTDRVGNGFIKVMQIGMFGEAGIPTTTLFSGENVTIHLKYECKQVCRYLNVSVGLRNENDHPIFNHHNRLNQQDFGVIDKDGTFVFKINRLPLPASTYRLTYSIYDEMGRGECIDSLKDALEFQVMDGKYYLANETPPTTHATILVDAHWEKLLD
jgi:lipopolysaccharide transport system ATP-binding protein